MVPWPVNHPGKGVMVQPAYSNLLQNSKFEGAVSGSPGTAPTNWTAGASGGSLTVTPLIVGNNLALATAAAQHFYSQSFTAAANTIYSLSIPGTFGGVLSCVTQVRIITLPAGATVAYFLDDVAVADTVVPSAGVHTLKIVLTVAATAGTPAVRLGLGCDGINRTGSVSFCCPQLVVSAYQMPYAASGAGATTSVTSTASTSGGNGLAIPLSAAMREALERSEGDGVELCAAGDGTSIVGWATQSATVESLGGELKVTTSAVGHYVRYSINVVPGGTYKYRWTSRLGTMSALKYSVYNITGGSDIIAATAYNPGDNAIIFTAPAGCNTAFVYLVRNTGVTGTAFFDNVSIQKLQPSCFTAAALCWMGVGSGDFVGTVYTNYLTVNNTLANLFYSAKTIEYFDIMNDGTSNKESGSYDVLRGYLVLKCVQINVAKTQRRVGYRRYTSAMVPIDANIVWSSWAAYDGSMNPLTHLRFGYGLTVPIGFLQVQMWSKSASDAEILGVLNYAV